MTKIDKVKWALYRTVTAPPAQREKAKWVLYGSVAPSTPLVLPKYPRHLGD